MYCSMNDVLDKGADGSRSGKRRMHCQLPRYKTDFKKKKAEECERASYVNETSLWVAKNGGGDAMLRHSTKLLV